jgi:hypothetical protein
MNPEYRFIYKEKDNMTVTDKDLAALLSKNRDDIFSRSQAPAWERTCQRSPGFS